MSSLLIPFFISFIVSLILGYPAGLLAEYLGVIDIPGSAPHKQHSRAMPLAGGLMMVGVLLILMIVYRGNLTREILAVLFGALIIFFFGLWDDRMGLSAGPKLVGQLIAAAVLISFNVQVHFMTVLLFPIHVSLTIAQLLNVLITLFWLVGITNAMNMIDSMDGIVAGVGIIASVFFMGAANLSHQPTLAFWAACLVGISAGLYYWNKLAVRFFLGDSGAQTLGFLLASFGILYNPLNRSPESSWFVPIMLLGVPIFDTTLVVISRIRRNQSVGTGRRDHTYHRLIKLGMQPRYAVSVVHIMALTIGGLAFVTFYLAPGIALIFFAGSVSGGLAFLFWLERKPALDEDSE